MEMKVEIISREIVKPATPTPPHQKHHKLSLLDQLTSLVYGHGFSCYNSSSSKQHSNNNDNDTIIISYFGSIISRLKNSLSKALSLFYPLAGRLTLDESSIDCNDEGIPFVVARCHSSLPAFLLHPNRLHMASHFLPSIVPPAPEYVSQLVEVTELYLFAVQVTIFDCGGVTIGTKGLHKTHDATSVGIFMKTWSDLAGGRVDENGISKPDFALASSLFPPRSWAEVSPPRAPIPLWAVEANKADGTCVAKVFEFSPKSVSILRAKSRSDRVPNPTRVEVVTGFIWKHAMAAAATAAANPYVFGPSVITNAVNMRPRTQPQLSPTAFGNLVFQAVAEYKGNKDNNTAPPELLELVAEIRRTLSEAKDAKFLQKLQGEKGVEIIRKYKQKLDGIKEDPYINMYRCSSWMNLGLDSEFGLGKPVWSGYSGGRMSSSFRNLILLMLNPIVDGNIQVRLILDEFEMNCLQSDPNFLSFASPLGGLSN